MSSTDTPENGPEDQREIQTMAPTSSPATAHIPISLEYLLPTVYDPNSVRSKAPNPPRSTKMAENQYLEQFPVMPSSLMFPPPKGAKSKSLTDAEMKSVMMKPAEVDMLAENLKNSEPPMSLEQTRKRRATIKEGRKANIEFIKARTARRISRAAEAVPGIEATDENAAIPPYPYPGAIASPAESSKTGNSPGAVASSAESSKTETLPGATAAAAPDESSKPVDSSLGDFIKWKAALHKLSEEAEKKD